MIERSTESPTRFQDLGLSKITLKALEKSGYQTPTPIQAGLIPHAVEGIDVLGQARTGTGKTAAFLIPLIEQLWPDVEGPEPQALVLVPTRELATQVEVEAIKLAKGRKVRTVVLCGGKPIKRQTMALRTGVDIVIGTPGRVLDHLKRGSLNLAEVEMVVLDEADRMLDIGFRPDIERILRRCPEDRQTLLLSATVPKEIEMLAKRYMYKPVVVNASIGEIGVQTIDQYYVTVERERKFETLVRLLERDQPQQAIVFCRTKRGTEKVARMLENTYDRVAGIHGDMQQRVRDRVMKQFREASLRFLVATDVLGRGIDVSGISHIINYDIPEFCDDYVHRVGRTGRMGRSGVAYTLVTKDEGPQLTSIEMRINQQLAPVRFDEPPMPAGMRQAADSAPVADEAPTNSTSFTSVSMDEPIAPTPEAVMVTTAEPEQPEQPAKVGRKKYRRAL